MGPTVVGERMAVDGGAAVRRWLLCVGVASLACAVLAGCGAHEPVRQSGPLCERTGSTLAELTLPADLEAVFDPVVAKDMAAMDAVGLTVAVQCAKSPLYVKGYGTADLASGVPATADTAYEIGSISKQFVAAEILKLARCGASPPTIRNASVCAASHVPGPQDFKTCAVWQPHARSVRLR